MSTIPKTQYELSDNVHPNVDRSPWGWIVIKGTRLRVATYSGYEEKERCKMLIESAQLATDGREELEKEFKIKLASKQDEVNILLKESDTQIDEIYEWKEKAEALQSSLKEKDEVNRGLQNACDSWAVICEELNSKLKEKEKLVSELRKEVDKNYGMIWKAFYLSVCDLHKEEQDKYWVEFLKANNL